MKKLEIGIEYVLYHPKLDEIIIFKNLVYCQEVFTRGCKRGKLVEILPAFWDEFELIGEV